MRHLSSLPDPGPPSRCVFQDRHQSHRGRRIKTLFPSRPSCTAKTISMYAVFKLRHASENSYLTSDTTEEKERVSNHLEAHQRYYGWLQSIKEMFSCQHGQTLFGGMGGEVFSLSGRAKEMPSCRQAACLFTQHKPTQDLHRSELLTPRQMRIT